MNENDPDLDDLVVITSAGEVLSQRFHESCG